MCKVWLVVVFILSVLKRVCAPYWIVDNVALSCSVVDNLVCLGMQWITEFKKKKRSSHFANSMHTRVLSNIFLMVIFAYA